MGPLLLSSMDDPVTVVQEGSMREAPVPLFELQERHMMPALLASLRLEQLPHAVSQRSLSSVWRNYGLRSCFDDVGVLSMTILKGLKRSARIHAEV